MGFLIMARTSSSTGLVLYVEPTAGRKCEVEVALPVSGKLSTIHIYAHLSVVCELLNSSL